MCGRYTLTTPLEGVREVFDFLEQPNLAPAYNIAPTTDQPVIRLGADGHRHLVMMTWGLIPAWALKGPAPKPLINARGESVADKPSFRSAFAKRRCLVPADGFYEWKKLEDGSKQPYRIGREDGGPFGFAGLWEPVAGGAEGRAAGSFTIVTTVATEALTPIHHRMPVILPPESFDIWLSEATPRERLLKLLKPFSGPLRAYPVSRRVNAVANQDADLIEALGADDVDASDASKKKRESPAQGSLF